MEATSSWRGCAARGNAAGISPAIPGPADPGQGHLVEVDKKAHERTPEEQAHHELLSTNTGIDDSNPNSHAQGYGQTNAEWSHHS